MPIPTLNKTRLTRDKVAVKKARIPKINNSYHFNCHVRHAFSYTLLS